MRVSQIIASASLLAVVVAATPARAEPVGEWRVADGTAVIRIRHCGRDLCGYIASTAGTAGKDVRNPNPRLRGRSVLGMEILINMRPAGTDNWTGTTYNAEDGQYYSARLTQQAPGSLKLEGCAPGGGLCGSQTWSRVR